MRYKRIWGEDGFAYAELKEMETPEVDAFIEEVLAVCKKHGFSIGHEDGHGSFLIEDYSEGDSDWLRNAEDETGSPY